MQTISLDILQKAALPTQQAHAILKVVELELASSQNLLATKADLWAVKADVLALKADLESKLAAMEGRLTRWVLTCILGQTAVLAGFGYFALTHLAR